MVEYEEDSSWEAVFAQKDQPNNAQCKDGDLWVNETDLSVSRRTSGDWNVIYDGHLGTSFIDHVSVLTREDDAGKLARALMRTLFAPSLTVYGMGAYYISPENESSLADVEAVMWERKSTFVDGRTSVIGCRGHFTGPVEPFEEYYWRGEDGLAHQWPASFEGNDERESFLKNGFTPTYALRNEISLATAFALIENGLFSGYFPENSSYGWYTAGDAGTNRRIGMKIATFIGEPYIAALNMAEDLQYGPSMFDCYRNSSGYTFVGAGTTSFFEIPEWVIDAESDK